VAEKVKAYDVQGKREKLWRREVTQSWGGVKARKGTFATDKKWFLGM